MATAFAETGADEHGDGGQTGGDAGSIDYETEAKKWGWKPPETLKDPSKGLSAQEFYERGQSVLPIVLAQNKALEKRIEQMEKSNRQASEFFSKSEQRAYDRAIADIRSEMEQAVESGDTKAGAAALEKMTKLEKPGATPSQTAPEDPAKRAEEFADWLTENRWYSTPDMQALRIYADAQADKIAAANGDAPLNRADLDDLAERVKAKYGDAYPEAFGGQPKPKPRNPVDGGGAAPRQRGGKSFNDLPPEAQAACDKWVKQKLIPDRETYVKNYQW